MYWIVTSCPTLHNAVKSRTRQNEKGLVGLVTGHHCTPICSCIGASLIQRNVWSNLMPWGFRQSHHLSVAPSSRRHIQSGDCCKQQWAQTGLQPSSLKDKYPMSGASYLHDRDDAGCFKNRWKTLVLPKLLVKFDHLPKGKRRKYCFSHFGSKASAYIWGTLARRAAGCPETMPWKNGDATFLKRGEKWYSRNAAKHRGTPIKF